MCIALDARGNIYTAGSFTGKADFNPGTDSFNIISADGGFRSDIFILKLDSTGNFIWAKTMGGSGDEEAKAITLDAEGNIYTTGDFTFIADFNPGNGTNNIRAVDGSDVFISKLDSSGNFVWAKALGGTYYDYGRAIAVDFLGNVYTTGNFYGKTDMDPGPRYKLFNYK